MDTLKIPGSGELQRNEVLDNVFAMYGGALSEVERIELIQHLRDPAAGVFQKTVAEVNAKATAGGANFAYWDITDPDQIPNDISDLFKPKSNKGRGLPGGKINVFGHENQADLFSPNPYGVTNPTEGYGLLLKNSLQSAIQDSINHPSVVGNPRLQGNLMKMYSMFDDETQATQLFKALGHAGAGGFRDMSDAVKVSINSLGAEFARVSRPADAARMASAAGTVGQMNGEMKLGDWLSYAKYRTDANGLFGTSGILMNMVVFGDAGATKAFIDGAGSLNFSNLLKPNVGSIEPTINGTYFMDYLADQDPGLRLFTPAESKQFAGYWFGYKNAKGKDFDEKRLLGWKRLEWTIGPNAGPMQKLAYGFHTYHPYQFITGLFTGETPQRMFQIGTGHGRFITQPAKWKGAAKNAVWLMKQPWYQKIMRFSSKAQAILAIPGRMLKDATQKVAKVVFEKVIMKVLIKLGLQAVVQAIAATLTAGVSLLLYLLYWILNKVSGGFLDRVVKGFVRLTFELIVSIILWVVVVVIVSVVMLVSILSYGGILAGEALFPPDAGYSPVLSYGYGSGQLGGGVNIEPIINPIDWTQYEPFSDNDCPLQINGQPATVCTQGPTGTWSHAGNGGNYAIDIAGSGIGVYAPEDGVASPDNISCLTSCEKLLTDSQGNYDATKMAECKGYVQKYGQNVLGFKFLGNETGRTYRFWHVFFDDDHLNYGELIPKGTFLGAVVPGASACSTGTHVHFEIIGDQHPDAAYAVMCDIPPLVCSNN
jgi:hypothetical protein